jgi:type I restriction enzyme S subunit
MRECFSFRKGLSITKDDLEPSGVPVISYGQIHSKQNSGVGVTDDLVRFVNESYLQSDKSCVVEQGDFIFADTSEDIPGCGNCVYVDNAKTTFAGYHTVIAHPVEEKSNKYFAYLFLSTAWREQVWRSVNAVKVFSVTQEILKDTRLLIPSSSEQSEIVGYLNEKCAAIDGAIANKRKSIEELSALKSRIIADAVTGRMEVE